MSLVRSITDYHASFLARQLTLAGASGSLDSLGQALFDAQVDLNPHQIEAAVFALSNPQQKGVMLADEVGLGKTIEAGLVMAQLWASRKRKLCVICPAHLRMQWALELSEKFHLPCKVIDSKAYRALKSQGNPFDLGEIVILSYAYAGRMADELRVIPFDLVVMDEAHKLRNAYKSSNKVGFAAVRYAFELRRKILLTATPIQNTLMELYGLSWLMDEHLFGSETEFKYLYGAPQITEAAQTDLKSRMQSVCHRTLRSQVQGFVKYTQRHAMTQGFASSSGEKDLHEAVMAYSLRENSYGMPKRVRPMLRMLLHHTLASSPTALAGTLDSIRTRLIQLRDGGPGRDLDSMIDELSEDAELDLEEIEAWTEAPSQSSTSETVDGRELADEIRELTRLIDHARSIGISSKTRNLTQALQLGFEQLARNGGAKKALIFTESRRTQEMLASYLGANGYAGKVVSFNGSNTGPEAIRLLESWRAANAGDDRVTGSRAVDIRSALVDAFKHDAEIMIATEAGAEGVNLQFCSLVINFDLPWNPQRIEQRIGRCHRYGQKHDVVVVNFLDHDNVAERRIHEILAGKFNLFDGMFGSSDEVLGAIESGIDFEKRVATILQTCRHPSEIEKAFDQLQKDMDDVIQARMAKAKIQLIEHFDDEVHDRLNIQQRDAKDVLDKMTKRFWSLSQWALADQPCSWSEAEYAFDLVRSPAPEIEPGHYRLRSSIEVKDESPSHLHRLQAPLGQWMLRKAGEQFLPPAKVVFDLSSHPTRISGLETEKGKSGWLRLELLELQTDAQEQFLLVTALRADGTTLDAELAARLFDLHGTQQDGGSSNPWSERLNQAAEQLRQGTMLKSSQAGQIRFKNRQEQLQRWADESVKGAERELDSIKLDYVAAQRESDLALTMEAQEAAQQKLQNLESKRRRARAKIDELEDDVRIRRNNHINQLKKEMQQRSKVDRIFEIQWEII